MLPVLGLDGSPQEVLEALRAFSAFVVDSPRLDSSVLRATLDACRWVHDLSERDRKELSIEQHVGVRGLYHGFDRYAIRRYVSFECGTEGRAEDRDLENYSAISRMLLAPNVWPSSRLFRISVERYLERVTELAARAMAVLAPMIGLPRERLLELMRNAQSQLRLIRYDPEIETQIAISPHTDYELFSLVYSDGPGLEVLDRDGVWHECPGDAMVLILGDLAEISSGGSVESGLHRVRLGHERRHSLVFFRGLCPEAWIGEGKMRTRVVDHVGRFAIVNFPHLRGQIPDEQAVAMLGQTSNVFKVAKLRRLDETLGGVAGR